MGIQVSLQLFIAFEHYCKKAGRTTVQRLARSPYSEKDLGLKFACVEFTCPPHAHVGFR